MNFKFAFLLSTLAGLSTLIGALIIFINKKKQNNFITSALAFASAVMTFICFFDLIPNGFNFLTLNFNKFFSILTMLLFIVIGIDIAILIDKITPLKEEYNNNNLFKIGIISMIAIILHNIPEGMATFIATTSDINLGILLTISIALHNIPEGISISLPIYYSTNNKSKAFLYTFISALSEPFGALIAYLILYPFINEITLGILYFIISGIMLQIGLFELLKESLNYKNYKFTFLGIILGIFIVLLTRIIF